MKEAADGSGLFFNDGRPSVPRSLGRAANRNRTRDPIRYSPNLPKGYALDVDADQTARLTCRNADRAIQVIFKSCMAGRWGEDMIAEMGEACLLTRIRLISRVITGIYDKHLRDLKISSAQFALLDVIYQTQPATRAEIGRQQHLDRSTLTRHLKVVLSEGWVEETHHGADGRSRPIVLTKLGSDLLHHAETAWRAAQVEAKGLLGKNGENVVMNVASRITDPTT
jgi:DNA-binding MarR family transcriptional regulator